MQEQCSIPGCEQPLSGRGWCGMHYARWKRTGNPLQVTILRGVDPSVRFWSKVDFTDGCWIWTGTVGGPGYGRFWLNGRSLLAHRYAYETRCGPIPEDLEIDHLCCNPSCVRPDHMEPVTCKVNQERRVAHITHCPQGHPYAGENLAFKKTGGRRCRACAREASRRWKERQSAVR